MLRTNTMAYPSGSPLNLLDAPRPDRCQPVNASRFGANDRASSPSMTLAQGRSLRATLRDGIREWHVRFLSNRHEAA